MASFDGSLVDIHGTVAQQPQMQQLYGQSPEISVTGQTYSLLDLDIFEKVEPRPSQTLTPLLKPLSATATEDSTLRELSQAVEGMRLTIKSGKDG